MSLGFGTSTGRDEQKRRADLLKDQHRARSEPGTASLVLDADPCPRIGRWVLSAMVEFAGARHHLAYWLGTKLHHGQERTPEYICRTLPHYLMRLEVGRAFKLRLR